MPPKYLDPDGVMRFPCGREVCANNAKGKREYYRRTRELAARQDELCAICGEFMVNPTLDHQAGRGMAGSKRDDRLLIDGNWNNAALCWTCNGAKRSKQYHWVGRKYVGTKGA